MTGNSAWPRSVTLVGVGLAAASAYAEYPMVGRIDLLPYGCNYIGNMVVYKGVIYLSGGGNATIHSVDAHDPSNLAHISRAGVNDGWGGPIRIVEDTAYVSAWSTMMRVFDVSNRGVLRSVWDFYMPGWPHSFGIDVYQSAREPLVEDADLDLDLDVDGTDLDRFLDCMGGPDRPPGC